MAGFQGNLETYIDSVFDVEVEMAVEVASYEIINLSFALCVKVLELV